MAGIAAPLAFAIAFFIVLAIAVCMVQLALQLPSAGGYHTYVSRALNPKAGFWRLGCSSCMSRPPLR